MITRKRHPWLPLLILAPLTVGPVVAVATPFDPRELPPCVTEDQDFPPCYWDAATRSNGQGQSFWIDRQRKIHYIDGR